MTDDHKRILLKHLKQVGVKIVNSNDIDSMMQDLKGILVSLNKLKKFYDREENESN
jgi:hypothetical protein